MPTPESEKVGLPPRVFLYTVDQLSMLLQLDEKDLHMRYLYHLGRDVGYRQRGHMEAVNIAPPNAKPDWRVSEVELIRWMKHKRIKFYDRGVRTR